LSIPTTFNMLACRRAGPYTLNMREPFKPESRTCALASCGVRFRSVRRWQRFCSQDHRRAWHNKRLAEAYRKYVKRGA
jgi:hypothetical protein